MVAVDRAARPRRRHRDGVASTAQLDAVRGRADDCGIGPFPHGLVSAPDAAVIVIDGGAVSRIGTADAGQRELRRIVVPATGRAVQPRWRSVTVVAATATAASAACAGALLRGAAAPGWLADLGVAGRLVDADGRVRTLDPSPIPDLRRERHRRA